MNVMMHSISIFGNIVIIHFLSRKFSSLLSQLLLIKRVGIVVLLRYKIDLIFNFIHSYGGVPQYLPILQYTPRIQTFYGLF
jgi:hypothetical protein